MLRIVMILTNGFDPDPRVFKEAKYLVDKGNKVTVLCWDRDLSRNNTEREIISGINVIRYKIASCYGSGIKQLPPFFKYVKKCRSFLIAEEYDFIHCNDFDGRMVGLLCNVKRKPIVFDMHELYEDVSNLFMKILFRKSTIALISKSRYALYENDLYLSRYYKSVRDKLIPLKNYPDSSMLARLDKTPSDKLRIGYFGGIRHQIAEFGCLFEAVKDMDDVEVLIRGAGPDLEEVRSMSSKYKNVTVGGPFDGTKELSELYRNVDIVFAGYRPDSATRESAEVVKFFECIVTSTPIVLTQAYRLMADRIVSRGYGAVCDTRNVEEIRKAVELMKDNSFRATCSENELRDTKLYDWNEAVKVLDEVYM